MTINVTVRPFTYTKEDGSIIEYERVCVNNMPLKPMYERDKSAYWYLIQLIKQGKEE